MYFVIGAFVSLLVSLLLIKYSKSQPTWTDTKTSPPQDMAVSTLGVACFFIVILKIMEMKMDTTKHFTAYTLATLATMGIISYALKSTGQAMNAFGKDEVPMNYKISGALQLVAIGLVAWPWSQVMRKQQGTVLIL